MLNFLKNFFTEQLGVAKTETQGETDVSYARATITQMKNGRYRLLVNGNEVEATYARRRDAVRGATRRGLIVA